MSKKKQEITSSAFGQIKPSSNIILSIILGIFALLTIVPFILVIAVSLTETTSLKKYGFSFIPKEFSLSAYQTLIEGNELLQSFGWSILITVIGTVLGLFLMSSFAYPLSRRSFRYGKFFNLFSVVPMLFSGGIIGSYLVMVNVLGLRNSIWALILPMCMSTFSIIILRTFYKLSVPESLIESAYIDGASEWKIYFRIILPLSLPGLTTVALFLTLGYWNDWFNAMMYIDDGKIVPLQYLLIRMQNNIEFMIANAMKMGNVQDISNLPSDSLRMAVVVISTVPILVVYPFFQKYFIGGLTIGAVKE
ncbi:putative aldouronate transport system permease protein [Pilibacter termitis]|uniref:Putative aldouronate transport system permease protein n=1 Tax=Pilibacter termitis TaxID=263852 RepID=A0A1T4QN48_9ENTE|nr:carbohydrate ABC transporter permease [Pilibacter termitis]SKA05192.1 putative aldouronate transport system permease protein [Pilibacter termitis]